MTLDGERTARASFLSRGQPETCISLAHERVKPALATDRRVVSPLAFTQSSATQEGLAAGKAHKLDRGSHSREPRGRRPVRRASTPLVTARPNLYTADLPPPA